MPRRVSRTMVGPNSADDCQRWVAQSWPAIASFCYLSENRPLTAIDPLPPEKIPLVQASMQPKWSRSSFG